MWKSVDLNCEKEHLDTRIASKTVSDRVRNFSNCGRSAQLLLLENGCWARLNKWAEFAVASKDGPLIKEILNTVHSMPTSWSQLNANRKGLPITVQEVLKRLISGSNEFGEESESVKLLCAEVFAKWFRIKKNMVEETDFERIYILDEEEARKGVIALIKNNPGYGFLAENGNVYLVQLKPYQPPPTSEEHTITQSGSEVDNHLNSSGSSSIDVGIEDTTYVTPITSTPAKHGVAPMFGMDDISLEEISSSNNKMRNESVLLAKVSNGVVKLNENQTLENYCKSESTAEKWLNMSMVFSDDEYDDDDDDDRLVIDEDQRNENINIDDLDETLEIPRFKETQSSPEDMKAAGTIPWKMTKILFSRDVVFPVVNSDQQLIQKVRESMVVKVKLEPGSYIPDHPVDDDDELMGNDDDDVADTTFTLMPTRDVVGEKRRGVWRTRVFDYRTEQWPC